MNNSKKLPELIVPILERVRNRTLRSNSPLEFWEIDNGPSILKAFFELSAELVISDIAEDAIPFGYVMVAYLFDWEAQGQSDGWNCLSETSDHEFEKVLSFYDKVGLSEEVTALRLAHVASKESHGDIEKINAAYGSIRHAYSIDLDRIEYLTQWFCDRADDLFLE